MASTKKNIEKVVALLSETFGIEADSVVIGIANEEGHCMIHMQGNDVLVGGTVNEIMGQAVAKMPGLMQEIMMAEILSHAKATKVN